MIQNQKMKLLDFQEKLKKLSYQLDHSSDEIKTHNTTIDILKQDLENWYETSYINISLPTRTNLTSVRHEHFLCLVAKT